MKFTFKKYIATGLYKSFELKHTDIKLGGLEVGAIDQQKDSYKYKISFAIKKERTIKEPAPFKWISLKVRFETEKEARVFIKRHEIEIQEKYDLYQFED